MNKTITVSVTQKNIDDGLRTSHTACPIALALRDLDAMKYSYVVNAQSLCDIHSELVVAYLPTSAEHFIQDFDQGLPVEPFTFEVSFLNQPVLRGQSVWINY
jgi:hypothetical protein